MPNLILGILGSSGAVVAASSYESIATVTVGSGGTATVDFTSIPSTYKHLQIRSFGGTSGGADIWLRFNSDTGTNYANHILYGTGSTAAAYGVGNQNNLSWAVGHSYGTGNAFGAAVCDVLDYGSTSKNKTIRSLFGYDTNGAGQMNFSSGLWMNSSTAISSINIYPASGTIIQHSSFALYGIKD